MHDWVIYLASIILKKKITLTKEELLLYRRHSNTYTGRSKIIYSQESDLGFSSVEEFSNLPICKKILG